MISLFLINIHCFIIKVQIKQKRSLSSVEDGTTILIINLNLIYNSSVQKGIYTVQGMLQKCTKVR